MKKLGIESMYNINKELWYKLADTIEPLTILADINDLPKVILVTLTHFSPSS